MAIASVSMATAVLGLRLGRRLDRAESAASRVGVSIDLQLEKLLPWWLSPLVPETALGYIAWATVGIGGLLLAVVAKRVKRLYH